MPKKFNKTSRLVRFARSLLAIVAAGSIGELDVLIDRIGALDGVERTTSAIVLATRIQR